MSKYDQTTFEALYNDGSVGKPFQNNTSRAITEAIIRQFAKDISDSFINVLAGPNDKDTNSYEAFDWISDNYNAVLPMGWIATVSGTGAVSNGNYGIDSSSHAQGVIDAATGAGTTAWASFSNHGALTFGTGSSFHLKMRNALQNLGNGTDRYTAWCGYFDNYSTVGEATNGAYFRYTDNVNGGKWQAVTRKAGVETAVDTGVAGAVGFHIFDIQIDAGGSVVTFTIDTNSPVTISTNIPTLTLFTGVTCKIQKSLGTTNRSFSQDWYSHQISRIAAR